MAESQIASDNEAGGREAATALAELIGGSGKVFVVNVKPGISTTDARAKGFEEGAKEAGLEYLGQDFSQDEPAKAASIIKAQLAKNPDLKGVFATNLFSAEGTANGVREAGKAGDVKIVGFDAGPAQVEQLEKGDVQALIAQKPADIGAQGVEQAVKALKGEETDAGDRHRVGDDHQGQPRREPGLALQVQLLDSRRGAAAARARPGDHLVQGRRGRPTAAARWPTGARACRGSASPTGAEIDPERLVEAALAAAREALAGAPDGPVGALGVASFAETGVLLDARGEPVAPAIAWHDSRGEEQAERLVAELGGERVRRAHRPGAAAAVLAGEVPLAARASTTAPSAACAGSASASGSCTGSAASRSPSSRSPRAPAGSTSTRAAGGTRRWRGRARPPGLLPEPAPGDDRGRHGRRRAAARPRRGAGGRRPRPPERGGRRGRDRRGRRARLAGARRRRSSARSRRSTPERVRAAVADGINVGWHAVDGRQCLLGATALGRRAAARARPARRRPTPRRARARGAGAPADGRRDRAARPQRGPQRADRHRRRRLARAGLARGARVDRPRRRAAILDRMAGVSRARTGRIVMAGGWADGPAAQAVSEAHLGPFELSGRRLHGRPRRGADRRPRRRPDRSVIVSPQGL